MTAKTAEQRTACLRVIFLANPPDRHDQVAYANWQTTMADARAALCLAMGVPPEYITAAGFDISDASYANVRAGWVSHIRQWGITMFDHHAEEAFALWQRDRPDLAAGDDWREAGSQAHKAAHPAGQCFHGARCVICHPFEEEL
jgi:alcohol dehydrogenase class IV